jgi:general secretion pathway protein M
LKDWFSRYSPREQLSLLLMAAAIACYALYFVAWAPVAAMRDDMARRNNDAVKVLQRVDAMVSEVLLLRSTGSGVAAKRNLTSLINRSTGRFQLSVTRLQPNSRGEIQVRLEQAAFNDLLLWLHDIEYSQGLLVHEVSITQAGSPGAVNASVRIGQGG